MKQIALTQGKFALVGDADFEWLNRYKWTARENKKGSGLWYAYRQESINGKMISVQMHRQILGLVPFDGILTDHQNGNGLDNQRLNIRRATKSQNACNSPVRKDNKTGFKGIFYNAAKDHYATYIDYLGKRIWLGFPKVIGEAIALRRVAEMELHGEFARQ